MNHEVVEFEVCSLFNSSHEYARGYNRAICSCGWKSAPSNEKLVLVALFKIHKEEHSTHEQTTSA